MLQKFLENKNKLNILLMTAYLEFFLGTEIWSFAIAERLKQIGHDVEIFSYLKGIMSDAFKIINVPLVDKIEDKYDLAIINHNGCLIQAPQSAYKIFISHGVNPEIEQPISGADKYISISEEVYQNSKRLGFDSEIILNPVNLDRFKSINPINKKLKNVLLLSNKESVQDKSFQEINKACKELGLRLTAIGRQFGTAQWETELWMNSADLVISLGRGIYESMAAGRNCIVAGYDMMGGFVDKKTYRELIKTNCSTRPSIEKITKENVIRELKKYNKEQGEINRKIAEKNHDVVNITNCYLNHEI